MEKFKLKISGELKIYLGPELVYEGNNAIGPLYPAYLAGTLASSSQFPGVTRPINRIGAYGDFAFIGKNLTDFTWGQPGAYGQSIFTTIFEPADFDGTVSELRLYNSSNGEDLYLAVKSGLSILKDSSNNLQVVWTIKIS